MSLADPDRPASGPVPPEAGADEGWQHLHPLTPLLRGGFVLLAVGYWLVSQGFDAILRGGGLGDSGGDPQADQVFAHPALFGLGAIAIVLAIGAVSWLSWRFARFRIGSGQVELRSGVLLRQHRQVPLERVQAVEISRPLLARAFGLAQVVVQSAGGRGAHLTVSYLALARAQAVRDELLALAGRSDERARVRRPDGIPAQPPAPGRAGSFLVADDRSPEERPVLAVPNGRLFVATLLHTSTLVLGLLVVVGSTAAGFGALGALTGLVPVVFGIGSNRVRELLKHGNFSVADLPDSLRVRHGFTDLRTTTVPLHRVQALEVHQPLWWRPFRWWRVRVNVAGIHDEHGAREETTVLPVGTFDDVLTLLTLIDARLDPAEVRTAATGAGGEPGWTAAGARSRLLDPLSWRRNGYAASADSVLIRRGRLHRWATITPHARIQSLTLHQGILDRWLGLASVALVSTPGPVRPGIEHLVVEEAERLVREEAARSRVARRPRDASCEADADPVD